MITNKTLEWSRKYGVSREALIELFDYSEYSTPRGGDLSEAAIQQREELKASKAGGRLWRNNVGACTDDRGNFIRYGLANKSAKQNKLVKSSDLIGITPITITPDMIGATIGVFTAIECKAGGWKWSKNPTPREVAQDRYHKLVETLGGIAGFCSGS